MLGSKAEGTEPRGSPIDNDPLKPKQRRPNPAVGLRGIGSSGERSASATGCGERVRMARLGLRRSAPAARSGHSSAAVVASPCVITVDELPADAAPLNSPHPRGRWRNGLIHRLMVLAVGVVVVIGVLAGLYVLSLPGVGDALHRARQIMAIHHEPPGLLPTPPRLVAAVVSTEDEHFYANAVVNMLAGAGRAALATLHTSTDPGGSTIGQQLAKRLYGPGSGLTGTLREIGLGVKLTLHYPARQILAMYLNVNYYGQGLWGVRQAAEGYFHTTPGELTWPEAAMIAGLLQAPSA